MAAQKPQRPSPRKNATAEQTQQPHYTALESANDENGQLSLPEVGAVPTIASANSNAPKQAMQYDYLDVPIEPTGRQNRFVLTRLQETPAGITTVEFTAMGVADPRPRIRDLRELGWRVETIQEDPHDVGRYVLMAGGSD